MKRPSLKTLQRQVSQAQDFYGKNDISKDDFFRWFISPFLAKTLYEVNCKDELFSKISEDLPNLKSPVSLESNFQLGKALETISIKAKTFLKKYYFFSYGLIILATFLYIINQTSDHINFWGALVNSTGILWVIFIASTITISSMSTTISNTYISRLSEYKSLLNFLRPLYENYKSQFEFWKNLTWQDFERETTKRLCELGYDALNTKLSGDEGVDVVIRNNNKKFIIQCKAMKSKIGPAFVRDFVGTIGIQGATGGMILSLNGFSFGAMEATNYSNLHLLSVNEFILLDRRELSKMIGW